MNTTGTWYPPSAGTGGMLTEAQLLINPPFAVPPMTITLTLNGPLYRICLDSLCRETPDWWQVLVWLEQFRRMQAGEVAE